MGVVIAPAPNTGFTEHSLYITNLGKEVDQSISKIADNITESLS